MDIYFLHYTSNYYARKFADKPVNVLNHINVEHTAGLFINGLAAAFYANRLKGI